MDVIGWPSETKGFMRCRVKVSCERSQHIAFGFNRRLKDRHPDTPVATFHSVLWPSELDAVC